MSTSITLQTPTYDECMTLIAEQGTNQTYTVSIDGEIITLPGATMRVFLMARDKPDWFMRF